MSFRLDWIYQGPNAGFMVAKDKGFYDEAGLNVDMGPGKGSGSTAQLIASKTSQFGFADGFVVGAGVAKGMELAMVGAIYRRNPTAAIVLAESGIKTPKELEGKTYRYRAGRHPVPAMARLRQRLQARRATRSRSSISIPPGRSPHW